MVEEIGKPNFTYDKAAFDDDLYRDMQDYCLSKIEYCMDTDDKTSARKAERASRGSDGAFYRKISEHRRLYGRMPVQTAEKCGHALASGRQARRRPQNG
jgi:hypothetical protein